MVCNCSRLCLDRVQIVDAALDFNLGWHSECYARKYRQEPALGAEPSLKCCCGIWPICHYCGETPQQPFFNERLLRFLNVHVGDDASDQTCALATQLSHSRLGNRIATVRSTDEQEGSICDLGPCR